MNNIKSHILTVVATVIFILFSIFVYQFYQMRAFYLWMQSQIVAQQMQTQQAVPVNAGLIPNK